MDEDEGLDGEAANCCCNCRFYAELIEGQNGECRRHAPVPITTRRGGRSDDYLRWQTVGDGEWCGDFEMHPHKEKMRWQD